MRYNRKNDDIEAHVRQAPIHPRVATGGGVLGGGQLWSVRQYVKNNGTYAPTMADFNVVSTLANNIITSIFLKTNISDENYDQYHHKLYETRIYRETPANTTLLVTWDNQLVIILEHEGIQTIVYNSGSGNNSTASFTLPFVAGMNKLYILTYTKNTSKTFACTLNAPVTDLAETPPRVATAIHQTYKTFAELSLMTFEQIATMSFAELGGIALCQSHFAPSEDITYDLGTPYLRWRNLYLDNMAPFMGATGLAFTGATGLAFTGATGLAFTGATGLAFTGATGLAFTGATGLAFTGATGLAFTGATGLAFTGATGLAFTGATGLAFTGATGLAFTGATGLAFTGATGLAFTGATGLAFTGATGLAFTGATGLAFTGATGLAFTGATGLAFTGATGLAFTGATGLAFTGATGLAFTGATGLAMSGALLADGSVPLTANWDTGASGYDILTAGSIRARSASDWANFTSNNYSNAVTIEDAGIKITSSDTTSDIEIDAHGGSLLIDSSAHKVIAYGVLEYRDDAYFNYDLGVSGTLTKGSGTFKIEHPVLSDKMLYHGFVESPEFGLIYCKTVNLINGKVTVDIDLACGMTQGTFEALCQRPRILLQNNDTFDGVKTSSVNRGVFTIECENPVNIEVTWLVYAERKDKFILDSGFTDAQGHMILEVSKDKPLRTKPVKIEYEKEIEREIEKAKRNVKRQTKREYKQNG
jgi:hypothetical protein